MANHKIAKVEVFQLKVPFAHVYKMSKKYQVLTDSHVVVLKLTTDKGLIGWGEANPLPPFTEETVSAVYFNIVEMLSPILLGADPTQIPELLASVDRLLCHNNLTKSAVDLALHDLTGKIYNVPAYMLLGGKLRSEIDLLWPIGAVSIDNDTETIQTKLKEGYKTFGLKLASLPVEDDIARVKSIEKKFGDSVKIYLDANQGWTVYEALKFVDSLKDSTLKIYGLEQPIDRFNFEGLNRIRNNSRVPINVDESLFCESDAVTIFEHKAADGFGIKISKNGGLAQSKRIANLADAFGMQYLMNSMADLGLTQAASLHLGCTLPNLFDCGHCYMSVLRMADDITNFADQIKDGVVKITDKPGLGVEVYEEKINKYTVKKETY